MRNRSIGPWTVVLPVVAVAVGAAGCRDMTSNSHDRHVDRIRSLDEAWKQAADRRDLDGMMAIYATDARELLPGQPPIVGRDSIRAFYRDLMERFPRFVHEFHPDEFVVAESGDLAVVRGAFRFTADARKPEEVQAGKYVGVWRHRDGDWRLLINISNSDRAGGGDS